MSKEMIAIPAGNLLRVAESRSVTTLSALKEKTGVDRKTLRAINEGKRVKETTLQSIADKLRIPITHLLNSDEHEEPDSGIDDYQIREIRLQGVDGAALREIARKTDEIIWFLDIDRMPNELEAVLMKLGGSLNAWFWHFELAEEVTDNLSNQISFIKTSAEIDKSVEELAGHKLKIFGGTYVIWHRLRPIRAILDYRSELRVALSIVPENKMTGGFAL